MINPYLAWYHQQVHICALIHEFKTGLSPSLYPVVIIGPIQVYERPITMGNICCFSEVYEYSVPIPGDS